MKIIIKTSIVLFLLTTLNTKAQRSTNFKEFNVGLYLDELDESMFVFPGASFLWGKTTYISDNFLLDYEYGIAFPTIITGKIGLGIGSSNNALVIGIRPWPPSGYFQYIKQEKHLFSIEAIPADHNPSIIINYGYRC